MQLHITHARPYRLYVYVCMKVKATQHCWAKQTCICILSAQCASCLMRPRRPPLRASCAARSTSSDSGESSPGKRPGVGRHERLISTHERPGRVGKVHVLAARGAQVGEHALSEQLCWRARACARRFRALLARARARPRRWRPCERGLVRALVRAAAAVGDGRKDPLRLDQTGTATAKTKTSPGAR